MPAMRGTRRFLKSHAKGDGSVILYRPVGQKELDLIAEAGFRAFPPPPTGQPIFYPILNEEHATQIARDWNTKDPASGYVGYVTRFSVRADFAARYTPHQVGALVGARQHVELWVPAQELDEFNANIVGLIDVIAEHRSSDASASGQTGPAASGHERDGAAVFAEIRAHVQDVVAGRCEPYDAGLAIMGTAMDRVVDDEYCEALYLIWAGLTDWVELNPSEEKQADEAMHRAAAEWLAISDDPAAWPAYADRWMHDELGYRR
jgi:hypothetical protein